MPQRQPPSNNASLEAKILKPSVRPRLLRQPPDRHLVCFSRTEQHTRPSSFSCLAVSDLDLHTSSAPAVTTPSLARSNPFSLLFEFKLPTYCQRRQPTQDSPVHNTKYTHPPQWPSRNTKSSSTTAARSAAEQSTSAPTTTAPAVRTAPAAPTEYLHLHWPSPAELGGLHAGTSPPVWTTYTGRM